MGPTKLVQLMIIGKSIEEVPLVSIHMVTNLMKIVLCIKNDVCVKEVLYTA
jgi:hypothetical protein